MPMEFEEIAPHDDGLHTYVSVKFPLFDSSGAIYAVCGISTDITERKQMEEEQAKLREQLYHVQKLESVGTLAGGIAHDFSNILTAIIGYGNLLQKDMKEGGSSRDYVQKILKSAERAANLTQGLLAFSRKQVSNSRPVYLDEIVKGVESLLVRVIREDIKLKTTLTSKKCIVMADVGQMEQVLMNLATNARDAMRKGGFLGISTDIVELDNDYIKTHGYGTAGRYALVSVSDTGVGMDEKTKERIFEPFFTTKGVGKGTGLGLAIVYGIIKQHNGYINIYSEPGKGTTFRIYLPVIESEVEKKKTEAHVVHKGGTETILIAEDEEDVREITKIVLEGHGYTVIEAVDGEDAIDKFRENKDKIHLLLFDIIMPNKNGKEAYKAIKEMRPDIKALFMSGYSEDIVSKKDLPGKGFSLIVKPVSPIELLKKVGEALDK
jgi:signal transduction histidine kinase